MRTSKLLESLEDYCEDSDVKSLILQIEKDNCFKIHFKYGYDKDKGKWEILKQNEG